MSERNRTERGPRSWEEARRMARESADAMTDEEDAAITAAAIRDPDNPPLTHADSARMRPIDPKRFKRWRSQSGPHKPQSMKLRVSLRLDPDIVAHFKQHGPGWQSRLNATLRKALRLKQPSN